MNSAKLKYKWKDMPWSKIKRQVFKLQKRIYQASKSGDIKKVHKLQRLLVKSWAAKLLAVRQVTQENKGKKTAGVDGFKALTPAKRLNLALSLDTVPDKTPTRRVWIPKPGKTEKRPLGIPTMKIRATQALIKLALEPQWEAKFDRNSYAFRPARSAHDAIHAIYKALAENPKYVLDADISKCFDNIDHSKLLNKINTYSNLRRLIKCWLKSGVIDKEMFTPTTRGTPQGGVASPLLALIALHGLAEHVQNNLSAKNNPIIIFYADDFVVLHKDLATVQQAKSLITDWLKDIGLELNMNKTQITHTLYKHQDNVGFNFLGFHVRQLPVGKYKSAKRAKRGKKLFKTFITPSQDSITKHCQKISLTIRKLYAVTQENFINKLNPIIRGWANYYKTVSASRTFAKIDKWLWLKIKNWSLHRHPNKSKAWVTKKYWVNANLFACKGIKLAWHANTHIKRYIKIQGQRSPYDGDWVYWCSRIAKNPIIPNRISYLLKLQQGKCSHCYLQFTNSDKMSVLHLNGDSRDYRKLNLTLVHDYCFHKAPGVLKFA